MAFQWLLDIVSWEPQGKKKIMLNLSNRFNKYAYQI